ncbi:MAG: GNAT family N-acetyltransferase [Pseudomonadota bacterium]
MPEAIRRLGVADAADYRALMLEAHASTPEAFTSSFAERQALPLPWWQARLSPAPDAGECVYGAFHDQALVGVSGLRFESRERTRHKATLFGMFVQPRARGQGIGQALVMAVLGLAQQSAGILLVQLTVTETNQPALRLYERCGFLRYGTEPLAVKCGDGYLSKLHLWRGVEGAVPSHR